MAQPYNLDNFPRLPSVGCRNLKIVAEPYALKFRCIFITFIGFYDEPNVAQRQNMGKHCGLIDILMNLPAYC